MDATDYRKYGVLYVDDEPQALKYFSKLYAEDFRVFTAESAEVARSILEHESSNIALLITDQRMPGETGVKLLEYTRASFPSIIRIITTAYSDLESAIAAVNSGGVYQYITKPWKLDDFRAAMIRALDYYEIRSQRDSLLEQKLSVLHGVLVLDRVRSFAAVAASLEGRVQRPIAALKAYIDQARRVESQAFGRDELLSLDLWAVARTEGQFLVQAVRTIQASLAYLGNPTSLQPATDIVAEAIREAVVENPDEGISIQLQDESAGQQVLCQPRAVQQIIRLLLNRVTDMDGDDIVVDVTVRPVDPSSVAVELRPRDRAWDARQVASLFSGVISKKHWLMGLDMDLLSSYFIAFDQGGEIKLSDAGAPAFVRIRFGKPKTPVADIEANWLDEAFNSADNVLELPSAD